MTASVHEWVVEAVEERTEADPDGIQDSSGNLWTSERRLKGGGEKFSVPFQSEQVQQGIEQALAAGDVIRWHGLLAPTTEEHLRAIVVNENQADVTRAILCDRVRDHLQADEPEVMTDGGRDVDAVSALAERMAEDLCLGFRWHDQRDRERAVEAFARVDVLQFPHVPASEAREAARAYVDALWAKDEIEAACIHDGEDEPDVDQLAAADWSGVEDAFAERAYRVGIDELYAAASTLAWRRHKIGGDYWTPMLRAQRAELRAAMQDSDYPSKPSDGEHGFGPEAVRYLLGVELHDQHTRSHWKQAKQAMVPYFERILRSHEHHQAPAIRQDVSEAEGEAETELVTDGGTDEGKSQLRCGDRVRDLGNQDDDAHVYVVEQLDETIDEHVLYTTDHGTEQTVYDYTRGGYDPTEPVVRVVFEESLEAFLDGCPLSRESMLSMCRNLDVEKLNTRLGFLKVYAYPRSRLGEPDREVATDGGTADLPPPKDGADPWCTWCDEDFDDPDAIWMIEGRTDSRWPAAFCSEHCAREWGCAADHDRVFRVDDPGEVLADTEIVTDGSGVDTEESQTPAGIGDRLGPRYPGNLDYGRNDRIPTNYGTISIDSETIWRFWNGAKQEVVRGHWEATCPCCYTEHVVEGATDEARSELWDTVLDCCDEVRWLPPSDYLDPCPICGRSHRERHECTAPALREPFPDIDAPAECTDCGYTAARAESIPSHDGSCPECESNAVRIGGESNR